MHSVTIHPQRRIKFEFPEKEQRFQGFESVGVLLPYSVYTTTKRTDCLTLIFRVADPNYYYEYC